MNSFSMEDMELFEAYYGGELSPPARDDFEQRLQTDKDFQFHYEQYRKTVQGLKNAGIRSRIRELHELEEKNTSPKSFRTYWISGIAASIALLFGYFFLFSPKPSSFDLYNQYFEPYPDVLSIRSSQEGDNTWLSGMKFYSAGEYEKAVEILSQSVVSDDIKADIIYYTGLSQLASNQLNEAEQSFRSIMESGSRFDEQTRWYLALTHIRQDEKVEALDLLNQIKDGDFKYEEALELSEKLE